MTIIISLILLCAVFYFFKAFFTIVGGIISFIWGIISSLGYLLFLLIASLLFLMWVLN